LYLITGKNLNENMCTCFGNLSQIVEMFALYFVDLEEGEYVIDVMGHRTWFAVPDATRISSDTV